MQKTELTVVSFLFSGSLAALPTFRTSGRKGVLWNSIFTTVVLFTVIRGLV